MPVFWLVLQAVLVLLGPLLLAWWIQRRYAARWKTWGQGAVTFLASQLLRIPVLVGLTIMFQAIGLPLTDPANFLLYLIVLAVTAGLFEETARYLVLRHWATDARRWRDGLMFGAGHGGIEAMLLVGGAVIGGFVLLAIGDPMIAELEEQSPQQAAVLAQQVEAIRNLSGWAVLLAVWERVVAITFHIAASLWVMRAIEQRRLAWWLAAVLLHAAFNGIAGVALHWGGALAAEGIVTAFWPLFLWIIWHNRPSPTDEPAVSLSPPEAYDAGSPFA